jgi:hypothetical protein
MNLEFEAHESTISDLDFFTLLCRSSVCSAGLRRIPVVKAGHCPLHLLCLTFA